MWDKLIKFTQRASVNSLHSTDSHWKRYVKEGKEQEQDSPLKSSECISGGDTHGGLCHQRWPYFPFSSLKQTLFNFWWSLIGQVVKDRITDYFSDFKLEGHCKLLTSCCVSWRVHVFPHCKCQKVDLRSESSFEPVLSVPSGWRRRSRRGRLSRFPWQTRWLQRQEHQPWRKLSFPAAFLDTQINTFSRMRVSMTTGLLIPRVNVCACASTHKGVLMHTPICVALCELSWLFFCFSTIIQSSPSSSVWRTKLYLFLWMNF